MKKLIFTFIAITIYISTFGQCETRKYISSAQKIFDHRLSSSDFSNEILFLTVDTIDASSPNQNSEYREYTSSKIVLKDFYQIFDLLKKEGSFFNYYEFINEEHRTLTIYFSKDSLITYYKRNVWESFNGKINYCPR